MKFKVIDITTGEEISSEKINKIAKENDLVDMNINQFYIGEDGTLIMSDDCGKFAYCDKQKLKIRPVFEGKYPDLEYFEAIMLGNVQKMFPDAFKNSFWNPQADLESMFPQTWPDTACGFSRPGIIAGQAFTTEITTVMKVFVHDTKEEYFGVFFGNKPAYIVNNANEVFFEDLRNRQLKSKYEAKKVY